ncbi:threonine/serine dehydratase [Streptomyces chrestomyceticus]|uniref:threonine ammonia-lyase n=1 Tax=Streptomyces chrestomyceticus TaxID=68185 RepID=UPI003691F00A
MAEATPLVMRTPGTRQMTRRDGREPPAEARPAKPRRPRRSQPLRSPARRATTALVRYQPSSTLLEDTMTVYHLAPAAGTLLPLSLDDVRRAQQELQTIAGRTPLLRVPEVDVRLGRPVYVKAENTQRAGSFKFRGAYLTVSRLRLLDRLRGIATASGGNHAYALALAGHLLDAPVAAVLPADSDDFTRSAITALGATVIPRQPGEPAEALLHPLLEQGRTLISPDGRREMISGAGTVALEMMEDAPHLKTLLVPLGSGALAAGAALVAQCHPGVHVIGVEPETSAGTLSSLSVGRRLAAREPSPGAGCLRQYPARLPFEILRQRMTQVITVSEAAIAQTTAMLGRSFKQVAEPSGAVAFAALLAHPQHLPDGPVGVILSGGNADFRHFPHLVDDARRTTVTAPQPAPAL